MVALKKVMFEGVIMKKMLSILFVFSISVALHGMRGAYLIQNDVNEMLVIECFDSDNIKYSKKIAPRSQTLLDAGFVKVIRESRNIKLYHFYKKRDGTFEKDLLKKIEPGQFRHKGEYRFFYGNNVFCDDIYLSAPTRNADGFILNRDYHIALLRCWPD